MVTPLSFECRYYEQLPAQPALQESTLLERDSLRSEEFKDKFCSEPYGRFIALRDECVIGRVRLYRRKISFGGGDIQFGGIGFVATHPSFTGRGVAKRLLKLSMEKLKADGCEVVFLVANLDNPALVELYGHFGFKKLKNNCIYKGKSGTVYSEDRGSLLAPGCSLEKFNLILFSHDVLDLGVGIW